MTSLHMTNCVIDWQKSQLLFEINLRFFRSGVVLGLMAICNNISVNTKPSSGFTSGKTLASINIIN